MLFTAMSCTMGTSIDGCKPFWLPACFVRINSLLSSTRQFRKLINNIYQLYLASMAAQYKNIQSIESTKNTSYTQTKKIPMLVMGVNKRNKRRRVHHSSLSTEPVLPISNLSLKAISLTHFTNKINITALDMKYFR